MREQRLKGMRHVVLMVLVSLLALPTPARSQSAPSPAPAGGTAPGGAAAEPTVSLDHIREALKQPGTSLLLRRVDIPADFQIHVLEQQKLDDILSKIDFRSGPTPAGGLYAYELQRRLFSPTSSPLMQPYAAFSGSELLTVALENLIGRYLVGRVSAGLTDAAKQREEEAARAEVERGIRDYCSGRPNLADIQVCARLLGL